MPQPIIGSRAAEPWLTGARTVSGPGLRSLHVSAHVSCLVLTLLVLSVSVSVSVQADTRTCTTL
eukprot:scaffold29003_cov174-Isochrysis_galbana.AAC.1